MGNERNDEGVERKLILPAISQAETLALEQSRLRNTTEKKGSVLRQPWGYHISSWYSEEHINTGRLSTTVCVKK